VRPLAALLAVLGLLSVLAPAASAQQPVQGAPSAIDGPSADIVRPSGLGLSVARDASGGLVYLKQVAGTPHVFVSPLVSGVFRAPVEVDPGLAGASSQPVIAAGNGGVLLIGFINGGELYVVERPNQGAAFAAPAGLASGASNPSISMTNLGKAYLAFATADGSGSDVRTAYYDNGNWALEGPPLNAVAADNAGTGSGRPDVTAAGDGVAIVVWGEAGHIYSRRVWGTTPSVVYEQADAPPSGCTEASADEPDASAGGDSSYAAVAFREQVTCGGHQQSRVLTNRLHASIYDGVTIADGLSGGPGDGAQDPQVAVTEYGQGWVTSERTVSNGVFAQILNQNTQPAGVEQVNSLPLAMAPDPVPATAGLYSTFIAWQQEPGASGPSEIRVRYAPDGVTPGPEMVASSPAQGPVDAADGIAVGGDVYGEAAVAWLQGAPGASQVMVEQMYQPPGPFLASKKFPYATTSEPVFSWTHPHGWGPMNYSLGVDGAPVAQTYANAAAPAQPVPDGPHSWQVFATNPGGQQSRTKVASVFIDTVPPKAKLKLRGDPLIRSPLRASLTYVDLPPTGEPRSDASGVAKLMIRWGDGTTVRLRLGSHLAEHTYRRTGRYRITFVVTDRAGNVTRVLTKVKIVKSLPKHAAKSHPGTSSSGGAAKPKARISPIASPPARRTGATGPTGRTAGGGLSPSRTGTTG
jgi:hypothetical protein